MSFFDHQACHAETDKIQQGGSDQDFPHVRSGIFKDETVIFGGKYNFIKKCKGLISKDEFDIKRLSLVNIQGELLQKGNRSFQLDVIENNKIIFKLNKDKHINIELPKLRNNIKKELYKLQQLNEIKQGKHGYTFSIRFDLKNIYISFEEFKNEVVKLNENRYLIGFKNGFFVLRF